MLSWSSTGPSGAVNDLPLSHVHVDFISVSGSLSHVKGLASLNTTLSAAPPTATRFILISSSKNPTPFPSESSSDMLAITVNP